MRQETCDVEWYTQTERSGQAIEKDGYNAMEQAGIDQGTKLGGQHIVI